MPHFLILAPDRPDALHLRLAHRHDHLDYWNGKQGVVKIAGAILEDEKPAGSSFLVEALNVDAVKILIAGDPFAQVGVFSGEYQIIAVRPAIGEWLPGA